MKKLPIGIQSIKKILQKGDYVYVDKTLFIKKLLDDGAPHFFMSRPRRFGKSLFLNTLEEVFKGNKELFKNCLIYSTDHDWKTYPVIYFDLYTLANREPNEFKESLKRRIQNIAKEHDLSIETPTVQEGLEALVISLAKKKGKVVSLIDEYDYPIINNLKNLTVAEKNKEILKDFFGTFKSLDRHLKFTFVTGVSKFSQVSLFSGPNNLKDITMDPRYAGMMGYTEEELKETFEGHIKELAKKRNKKIAEIYLETKQWYNGYRFSKESTYVYNPFSTLHYMDKKEAASYWYSTGTPSFLIDEVKKHPQSVIPLSGTAATESQLMDISSLSRIDLVALMYQTGYLTIQDYIPSTKRYQLGFPNEEVKEAFLETLITHFAKITPSSSSRFQELLEKGNLPTFFEEIKSMIASFPYQLFIKAREATYHSILLGILKGIGLEVYAEQITNQGRSDLIIQTEKTTYLIEIKIDATVALALEQIQKKKYYQPYLHQGKKLPS